LSEAVRLDPFDANVFQQLEEARRAQKESAKPEQSSNQKTDFLKELPAIFR
jgi:hypothetical protein